MAADLWRRGSASALDEAQALDLLLPSGVPPEADGGRVRLDNYRLKPDRAKLGQALLGAKQQLIRKPLAAVDGETASR